MPETPQRPTTLSWVVAWTAMVIGIAASLAANVAHATPTVAGRTIAGWAPVALLLVVEVLAHTPRPRFWVLAWARYLGTAIVAGVAATASYRHMRGLALQAGEDWLTASTLPLSADGLILVASVSLMALAYERRAAMAAEEAARPAPMPMPLAVSAMPQPDPVPLPPEAAVDPAREAAAAVPGDAGPVPLPEAAAAVPADADPVPLPAMPDPVPLPLPLPWKSDAPLPDALAAGLDRFPDETRRRFERAYRIALAADAAGHPLTGAELGAQCERGERWGRDRLSEVRTTVRGRVLSGVS
ncbi:uncharacterized protein DUF2637 [Actinoplanes italicus]|uniref:Uncharacterized protein DUF2637 n=1 Tax=Actinoplanes italicus TaxID=113567 RepID=A0A2T0KP94_9ACTN|nr:uncharacterized protein DUF2637 [Actinoplanes italicus]